MDYPSSHHVQAIHKTYLVVARAFRSSLLTRNRPICHEQNFKRIDEAL